MQQSLDSLSSTADVLCPMLCSQVGHHEWMGRSSSDKQGDACSSLRFARLCLAAFPGSKVTFESTQKARLCLAAFPGSKVTFESTQKARLCLAAFPGSKVTFESTQKAHLCLAAFPGSKVTFESTQKAHLCLAAFPGSKVTFENRLSYEQFSAFLANIKELNAHRQSREETLRKADEIFGPDNKDLYTAFDGLLSRHLPS
ncbi:unnamed protein product [Closterium sp. NIES-54]